MRLISAILILTLTNCGDVHVTEQAPVDTSLPTNIVEKDLSENQFGWSLHEMENERFFCLDDNYLNEQIVEVSTEDFCRCKVESVSIRWDYELYKHRSYSYDRTLSESGSLARCLDPVKILTADDIDQIKADRLFVATDETESQENAD